MDMSFFKDVTDDDSHRHNAEADDETCSIHADQLFFAAIMEYPTLKTCTRFLIFNLPPFDGDAAEVSLTFPAFPPSCTMYIHHATPCHGPSSDTVEPGCGGFPEPGTSLRGLMFLVTRSPFLKGTRRKSSRMRGLFPSAQEERFPTSRTINSFQPGGSGMRDFMSPGDLIHHR